jgi:hypothetical protein
VYFAQVIPCINSCKIIPIVAISTIKPTKRDSSTHCLYNKSTNLLNFFVNTVLPDKIIGMR